MTAGTEKEWLVGQTYPFDMHPCDALTAWGQSLCHKSLALCESLPWSAVSGDAGSDRSILGKTCIHTYVHASIYYGLS